VHSRGNPGFLLNELNMGLQVALTDRALLQTSLNFTPRSGSEFSLGDSFDLDIAQLEWLATADGRTSLFVGKLESVLGLEYKERKASNRFGITPSLLHRYTAGTALGIKARSKLLDEHLIVAAALTNGSFNTEQFHFYEEVDSNLGKTVSARVAGRFNVGDRLEIGLSGQYGTQDRVTDNSKVLWFAGADAHFAAGPFELKAQWLTGAAPGDDVTNTYGLELLGGGYVEVDYLATSLIGVLGRAEFRDARVWLTDERLYLTQSWRATAGVRLAFTENIILKAEYLFNGEYGGPAVRNNLFTSSLLLVY
jgi:opacity protein-like surface antigen